MSAEQTGSSSSGGSEPKPNPADFLAALARGEHPADSVAEPMVPLPSQSADGPVAPAATPAVCPKCGSVTRNDAAFCATCGAGFQDAPASSSAGSDGEITLEPIGPGGESLAAIAAATRPARRRTHRPMSPKWRYAIIPMAIMAVAMLFIGGYAVAAIRGAITIREDDTVKAKMMLLAFPVALILIAGCAVIWMDTKRK
jgi:hypothetical protein